MASYLLFFVIYIHYLHFTAIVETAFKSTNAFLGGKIEAIMTLTRASAEWGAEQHVPG